jgi:archaemetzincin
MMNGRCAVFKTGQVRSHLASQFYKVAIHELGHTQGLPHCPNHSCYMRDVEGGNPTDEEDDFCFLCREYLVRHGWRLK